jgi:DNA-binding NtrC family response regulator
MANILVVDDEESIRFSFHRFLAAVGHRVVVAGSYAKAMARMEGGEFDLIFADIVLEDGCGINILREVKRRCGKTVVVIMTAYPSKESQDLSHLLNAVAFVVKPLGQAQLLAMVTECLMRQLPGQCQDEGWRGR